MEARGKQNKETSGDTTPSGPVTVGTSPITTKQMQQQQQQAKDIYLEYSGSNGLQSKSATTGDAGSHAISNTVSNALSDAISCKHPSPSTSSTTSRDLSQNAYPLSPQQLPQPPQDTQAKPIFHTKPTTIPPTLLPTPLPTPFLSTLASPYKSSSRALLLAGPLRPTYAIRTYSRRTPTVYVVDGDNDTNRDGNWVELGYDYISSHIIQHQEVQVHTKAKGSAAPSIEYPVRPTRNAFAVRPALDNISNDAFVMQTQTVPKTPVQAQMRKDTRNVFHVYKDQDKQLSPQPQPEPEHEPQKRHSKRIRRQSGEWWNAIKTEQVKQGRYRSVLEDITKQEMQMDLAMSGMKRNMGKEKEMGMLLTPTPSPLFVNPPKMPRLDSEPKSQYKPGSDSKSVHSTTFVRSSSAQEL